MQKARVLQSTGIWYKLQDSLSGEILSARARGKLKLAGYETTNPLAVGDWVMYEKDKRDEYNIVKILPRENCIIRKSVNLSHRSHILASNIDQVLLLVTLKEPETSLAFIDRCLVAAESYRIKTVLVFNKWDLYTAEDMRKAEHLQAMYAKLGYASFALSLKTLLGVDTLESYLKEGVSMLLGHSGVGKSSTLNAISPELRRKVAENSLAYHKQGKHTTTQAEMLSLPQGGFLIDTPGIRGFGLVDLTTQELGTCFPEFDAVQDTCHFDNCTHIAEKNCAIQRAFARGEIAQSRMQNYIHFFEEIAQMQQTYRHGHRPQART